MIEALRNMEIEEIVSRQVDTLRLDPLLAFAECLADDFKVRFTSSGPSAIRGSLDTEKIDRAIQNLLSNAFEAVRTAVRMEWYEDEDAWVLRVVDDGIGIPDNIVIKIFERGFTSGKPQGTGIGLAQVKSLADGHDGSIHCDRVEDRTVFTLTLRNVFAPILSKEAGESQPVAIEKPILFLEIGDPQLQSSLFPIIENLIPQYRLTSDKESLIQAKVVCTDSLETALLASDIGSGRVWNPSLELMRNLRFAEALRDLATNELANMA